jgi:N-formylglutamate deformylase
MTFTLRRGTTAMLVSMPHVGTEIPGELQSAYVPSALAVEDTDWHLNRLYNFLDDLGVGLLMPRYSRYVIDLNRPPDDVPMYPGASNTELCPTHFFSGDLLYRPGQEPSLEERRRRRGVYWQPYHTALKAELDRVKAIHGYALLWDAHSIRSQIPWLFDGTLPSLNIGTAGGASVHSTVEAALDQVCKKSNTVSHVVNGRFKGGYITRHYGDPQNHVHAVQLEMCQALYMQEVSPYHYDGNKAKQIQPLLKNMMVSALDACREIYAR